MERVPNSFPNLPRRQYSTAAASSAVTFPARKKSFAMDFPNNEEEGTLRHFSHLQHPLAKVTVADLFTCAGCKEYGAGTRFSCQQCEFQLHDFCALSPPSLKRHSLHGYHQLLVLHAKPKTGGILWPRCDICGKATKGFTFRCSACNFQMHPCCAMLSAEIKLKSHSHILKLLPAAAASNTSNSGNNNNAAAAGEIGTLLQASSGEGLLCGECKRTRPGKMYRCKAENCEYRLHAVCAKSMINGLKDNGIKPEGGGADKPNVLGKAARLASQVVIEFIGGLVEGFGEGVGEVLIQNLVRSTRRSSRNRTSRSAIIE